MATSIQAQSGARRRSRRVEHELDLVEGAIALVARGDARRVSLVVGHGPLILPRAQAIGRQSGVIVRAVWYADAEGCDIVVEPLG